MSSQIFLLGVATDPVVLQLFLISLVVPTNKHPGGSIRELVNVADVWYENVPADDQAVRNNPDPEQPLSGQVFDFFYELPDIGFLLFDSSQLTEKFFI